MRLQFNTHYDIREHGHSKCLTAAHLGEYISQSHLYAQDVIVQKTCLEVTSTNFLTIIMCLSRRLDRCDRVIQNESRDPNGGNVYYVTMQIAFLTRKFRNVERNSQCDIVHTTTEKIHGKEEHAT